jgi:hypothetical protein
MPLQSLTIDPNAQFLTSNQVIDKINTATNSITRPAALCQDELKIVKTAPASCEYHVRNVHRKVDGLIEIQYDDIAVP